MEIHDLHPYLIFVYFVSKESRWETTNLSTAMSTTPNCLACTLNQTTKSKPGRPSMSAARGEKISSCELDSNSSVIKRCLLQGENAMNQSCSLQSANIRKGSFGMSSTAKKTFTMCPNVCNINTTWKWTRGGET